MKFCKFKALVHCLSFVMRYSCSCNAFYHNYIVFVRTFSKFLMCSFEIIALSVSIKFSVISVSVGTVKEG